MRTRAKHIKPFFVALLMAAAGCIAASELAIYKERPIRFPHVVHGEKAELECSSCHMKGAAEEVGMPSPKACQLCHKDKEDVEKILKPFLVDGKVKWTDVTALPEDVKFSHKVHIEKDISCGDCHSGIETSKGVTAKLRVEMGACTDCHAREKVGGGEASKETSAKIFGQDPGKLVSKILGKDPGSTSGQCNVCHEKINQDWQPANHERSWKKAHGQVARMGTKSPNENNCALCHTDASCTTCHKDEEPSNHNIAWRQRGHGVAASIDRSNCTTCHQTDSCASCHAETAPRSHTGSWGSPRERHCATCHFPLKNEQCFVCHKDDSSHAIAASPVSQVPAHQYATSCVTCHQQVKRIPHPYTGDGPSCRRCHR